MKQPYTFSCDVWSLGCIIYGLLSGSLPFDHKESKDTIKATLTKRLVFDLPCWDNVTDKAKDLISQLLVKEPTRRITIDKAMQHPWLARSRAKYTTGLTPIKQSTKKGAFAAAANNSSPYERMLAARAQI